ncbi:unnamed protein product [Diplocarpon coronariae]
MKFTRLILVKFKGAVSFWTLPRYVGTRSSNLKTNCLHLPARADVPVAGI